MSKKFLLDNIEESIHLRLKVNSAVQNCTMREYVLQAILMKFFMDENPDKKPENFPAHFDELGEPKYKSVREANMAKWNF